MAMRIYVSNEEAAFFNNNKMGYADSIPTSGSYKVGDFIISSTQLDGIFGWVCTEEGTPGKWEVIGSGAASGEGKLISINASKVVDTAVNQISLTELGLAVDSKDKLIVHFNSMFLMEGVDYEISVDGNTITKLGGGYWNESKIAGCLFTFELLKNVENVDADEIKLDSKLICEKNNVTVTSAVSEVNIGINGFNKSKDTLIVYKNATYLIEGIDYEIDANSSKIVSLNGIWNENADSDYIFTFVVFKEVATINPDAVIDTVNIVDGSVTMDKLSNDVKQAIEDASNIDLSRYAIKSDVGDLPSLQTTAKDSLVDAINELFQNANNGKELIANAIGEPLSSNDTFSAMSTDINNLLSTFKTNMINKGINLTGSETLYELILKVDELNNVDKNACVVLPSDTIEISKLSNNSLILKEDGTLWGSGANNKNELGLGDVDNRYYFNNITDNVDHVVSGSYHSFIIKKDGTIWGFGDNGHGELGSSSPSQYTIPTQINIDDVKKIECGGSYTMLLKNDGTLWACGDNTYSKLGLGNQDTTFKFTQVSVTDVKDVSCGNNHTFILKEDGTVWSCGSMHNGQTGHGISQGAYKLNFTQVDIDDVKEIFCTFDSTFIIKNNGTLWACGNNGYGQLGLGDTTSIGTFTQVDIDNVKQVVGRTHTVIVKNDGTLWVSGYNNYGELGLGDNTNRKNFTQVDIDNVKLAKTSDSYSTLILKNDGTVWGCGRNYAGELGLGTETKINSFTKTFKQITMNYSFE